MSMWPLRIAPILAAVTLAGCLARTAAPVSFPGAIAPAEATDRPAEAPAIADGSRPVGVDRRRRRGPPRRPRPAPQSRSSWRAGCRGSGLGPPCRSSRRPRSDPAPRSPVHHERNRPRGLGHRRAGARPERTPLRARPRRAADARLDDEARHPGRNRRAARMGRPLRDRAAHRRAAHQRDAAGRSRRARSRRSDDQRARRREPLRRLGARAAEARRTAHRRTHHRRRRRPRRRRSRTRPGWAAAGPGTTSRAGSRRPRGHCSTARTSSKWLWRRAPRPAGRRVRVCAAPDPA